MDVRQKLARNLRALRQGKGWSQEAFADEAGLHRTYISDLERGARNPTITVVEKLALALGVEPGRLLDYSPARGPGSVGPSHDLPLDTITHRYYCSHH